MVFEITSLWNRQILQFLHGSIEFLALTPNRTRSASNRAKMPAVEEILYFGGHLLGK
jgi:hypothetical protein